MKKLSTMALLSAFMAAPAFASPTGGFIAMLDKQQNHGDSRRSVVFYDTSSLNSPLFSVFIGFENGGFEDPGALTIDHSTGDVYVAAFDSGPAGGTEIEVDGDTDTTGDIDLFKIDFQAAYNHWNANGQTYRTYGSDALDGSGGTLFDSTHANTHALPGVVNKIGEVARTDNVQDAGGNFTDLYLDFVDQDNLLLIDGMNDANTAAGDHQIRVLNRVSNTSGNATVSGQEGGYNNGTSESWESKQLGLVNLEFDTNTQTVTGGSDVIGTHYVNKDGVQGLWILEDDGDGDDVAFFEIGDITGANNALNGYKEFNVGVGPDFPTSFAVDDDPTVNAAANDGTADKIFVDPNTGNLVIVESGFFNSPQHEPKVIVREVDSYNDANGQIDFGAWQAPVTVDTTGVSDDDTAITDGRWTAYDPTTNTVYFYDTDNSGAGNGGSFAHDWYALDLTTGNITVAELDADVSNGLFGNGDQVEFFRLAAAIAGDFDNNGLLNDADIDMLFAAINGGSVDTQFDVDSSGTLDTADATHWIEVLKGTKRGDANLNGEIDLLDFDKLSAAFNTNAGWEDGDFNGDGTVDLLDFDLLSGNFGFGTGGATIEELAALQAFAGTVPEPASLALLGFGGLAFAGRRRK
ncbi:PEP-CTERM sorting domain-containing protein [Poriferisphaera sp. WC338]|uniref:PEP-CTERM sorting domain-containing protein n=1 Tax=Poriferisphaera sp. WC338 TaxID=3425129 RepID=UPI003D8159D4